jgi:RNA polymerase sigma-70 factor (ECF subfamily)
MIHFTGTISQKMSIRKNISEQELEELVSEAQQGNTRAFGDIYDSFFDSIFRFVYFKVDASEVDDLVGIIFIKSWEKITSYKPTVSFKAWLFRIAHNTVIDHYRTLKHENELTENVEDNRLMNNPKLITEQKFTSRFVRQAIRHLEKKYQQIIILKYINELSNKEIADILHISEENVRTMQFRGLKKLKTIIQNMENGAENLKAINAFTSNSAITMHQ